MAQDSAVFTRVINLLLRTPTLVRIANGTSSTNSLTLVECLRCFRQLPSDPDLVDTLQEGDFPSRIPRVLELPETR